MRKPRIYIRVLCISRKVKHNRRLDMCGTEVGQVQVHVLAS